MSTTSVSAPELRHLASTIRVLAGDLAALAPVRAIDGGGGTNHVDEGVFEFGALTGSRLRHATNDAEDLAERLDQAAAIYEARDQNVATAAVQSAVSVSSAARS